MCLTNRRTATVQHLNALLCSGNTFTSVHLRTKRKEEAVKCSEMTASVTFFFSFLRFAKNKVILPHDSHFYSVTPINTNAFLCPQSDCSLEMLIHTKTHRCPQSAQLRRLSVENPAFHPMLFLFEWFWRVEGHSQELVAKEIREIMFPPKVREG